MAGRRILDAAKLVQAARSVAKQHAALRSEQLDRYNKSSTVAKQAKYQSDRIVLTLQAAAALARRLAEDEKADQFANTAASARAEEGPGNPDQKSTSAQHEKSTDSNAPGSHRNVDEESGDGVVEQTAHRFRREGQYISGEPRSNTQRLDELIEEVNLNTIRTKRISESLGSQPSAEEIASNETLANAAGSPSATDTTAEHVAPDRTIQGKHTEMRESRVPATRIGRLWQYGGLATSMALGAIGESLRRATGSSSEGSLMMNPANMERLVARLSRMRGAALKLGQVISFQGRHCWDFAIR
jgi:aarF domain-containing kinase